MDILKIKYFYFLGIGGIGMSALARYFYAQGKLVAGYDKTPTELTGELAKEGIIIHFEDNINLVHPLMLGSKEDTLIIYTPAIPIDHAEFNFFKKNNYNLKKRSEVLGMISRQYNTVAVAGTHGKTTTSSLIAHVLKSDNREITAFLGGITQNYHSNLLLSENPELIVAEADEFDRSFLTLFPYIAIITSLDPDHLDIYGSGDEMIKSYQAFSSQVKSNGKLILKKELSGKIDKTDQTLTYSLDGPADYYKSNLRIKGSNFYFDLHLPGSRVYKNLHLGLPGIHNVENAIAASAAGDLLNVQEVSLRNALASYSGVKRRFEYQIKKPDLVYIDDYAHHPGEITALIESVKAIYPGRKITGIFQPHLYSRTRDFAEDFAKSLELLDELILLEIYPARELPIPGITSEYLLEKVNIYAKKVVDKKNVLHLFSSVQPEVLLTIGAGDIDKLVNPIKEFLLNKGN